MKLQLKDSNVSSVEPFRGTDLEGEVGAMVATLTSLTDAPPDEMVRTCMAYMGRCTEIWLQLLRLEQTHRQAKTFRVTHLQKVMDLIEFEFKGASRLVEVARQEVELSR